MNLWGCAVLGRIAQLSSYKKVGEVAGASEGNNIVTMLWQRWDEVKMLTCLRMMDEMERRAGLHVTMNGTHSDLSVVVVVAFFGKSASFRER